MHRKRMLFACPLNQRVWVCKSNRLFLSCAIRCMIFEGLPKPGTISEANAPRSIPGTVRPLILSDVLQPSLQWRCYLLGAMTWIHLSECCQASHACRGQLHIVIVNHDASKSLCWIEFLQHQCNIKMQSWGQDEFNWKSQLDGLPDKQTYWVDS